ncbi:hypothetical protein [Mesorhizobium sp. M1272]|uniref:hypothetical protein n=1 Tax=Mesorhizobium sp. M1272 TaxID=2957074 RepID=UPI003335589F
MTRDRPQGFEWVRFKVVEGTNDRIDRLAEMAGLDRGEFLQRAIARALEGVRHECL